MLLSNQNTIILVACSRLSVIGEERKKKRKEKKEGEERKNEGGLRRG